MGQILRKIVELIHYIIRFANSDGHLPKRYKIHRTFHSKQTFSALKFFGQVFKLCRTCKQFSEIFYAN